MWLAVMWVQFGLVRPPEADKAAPWGSAASEFTSWQCDIGHGREI
jgi:hypothetical protein